MRYFLILLLMLSAFNNVEGQSTVFKEYDLVKGPDSSAPCNFYAYRGKLYFSAITDSFDREPWVLSLTSADAHMLANLSRIWSDPNGFVGYKDKVYFMYSEDQERYLGSTDGTTPGTLRYINQRNIRLYKHHLFVYDDTLYYTVGTAGLDRAFLMANDSAYHLNQPFLNISNPSGFCTFNRGLYFINDDYYKLSLCMLRGPSYQVNSITEINWSFHNVSDLVASGSNMYFMMDSLTLGQELYITDGTASGTKLFANLCSGTCDGVLSMGPTYNGKFYFTGGDTATSGYELYVTDGTTAGTAMLKDINPGKASSKPADMYLYKGKMYFSADDGVHGRELWVTDGTANGTVMVADIDPAGSSSPAKFIAHKNFLYFTANRTAGDNQLYVSDGTAVGTKMIAPANPHINALAYATATSGLFECSDSLFFAAKYNDDGIELWSLSDSISMNNIADVRSGALEVYPNPTKGAFTIRTGSEDYKGTLTVYNTTGQLVLTRNIKGIQADIHMPSVQPGMYLLRLQNDKGNLTNRVSVE